MELWKSEEYLKDEFINKRKTASSIAKELGVPDSRIEYYLGRFNLYGVRTRFKDVCDQSKFKVNDPVFCYYAGLIATDGYVDEPNNRVSLRLCNYGAEELLNTIKDYFKFTGSIRKYRNSFDLTISSRKLLKRLAKLNVEGVNKTYTLKFPNNFYNEACAQMYLRGVLDGDGNIKKPSERYRNGQFRLVTSSKDFIEGAREFINKTLGTETPLSVSRVKGVEYPKIEMKQADSMALYNWLYSGFPDFRLNSKYEIYLKLKHIDKCKVKI